MYPDDKPRSKLRRVYETIRFIFLGLLIGVGFTIALLWFFWEEVLKEYRSNRPKS